MTKKYSIYSKGELLAGMSESRARENVARVFKASGAFQERLFSGKKVLIKKGVDTRQAHFYKQKFEECGVKCIFKKVLEQPDLQRR